MADLKTLIRRFLDLFNPADLPPTSYHDSLPKSFADAYEAAQQLWDYPRYDQELTTASARKSYIYALIRVADYFQYATRPEYLSWLHPETLYPARISHHAIAPLKRAYALDDGQVVATAGSSYKEFAAHRLGIMYKEAQCHNSAVWWLRRALELARNTGNKATIIENLHQLAWNLETLARYKDATQHYDGMLDLLSTIPRSAHALQWIEHAAMFHVRHGDEPRGEAIMRELIDFHLSDTPTVDYKVNPLPGYFYWALNSLVMHYIEAGRVPEALELANTIIVHVDRFDEPEWVCDATHGLLASAFLHTGQLGRALTELSHVHDVMTTTFTTSASIVQIMLLWIDIARIHAATGDFERAIVAYEILAFHLGSLISDRKVADTTRLRLHWLDLMARVTHEMVSVWLTISEPGTRRTLEATVANTLLQLKANVYLAIEAHKLLRFSPGHGLLTANRRYAAAARRVAGKPDAEDALLELEEALFLREEIERMSVERAPLSSRFGSEAAQLLFPGDPVMRGLMELRARATSTSDKWKEFVRFDFRKSRELREQTLLLDYSLIENCPPVDGLPGPPRGRRYVGVRLTKGDIHLVDLGVAEQIDVLCGSLVRELSAPPAAAGTTGAGPPNRRHAGPAGRFRPADAVDIDALTESVYDQVVAPFEPLSTSLFISPDGVLSSLPFHALRRGERYLVEDIDIAYCHSLLQKESLSRRQLGGSVHVSPPKERSALLLGDPAYQGSGWAAIPGAKQEVTEVAKLLRNRKRADGSDVFEDVQAHVNAACTVSRFLEVDRPLILHVAAHGMYDARQTTPLTPRPLRAGGYYRWVEEIGAEPLGHVDRALLGSTLILSDARKQAGTSGGGDDPANGRMLTALELASLNLLNCQLVVLSTCDSGVGERERGAGVLGFQFAVQASFARAGLVSLWKILDRETSTFMVEMYQSILDRKNVKSGYLDVVRRHCRRNGQRVHPYYWAAFVFIDQEYEDAFFKW